MPEKKKSKFEELTNKYPSWHNINTNNTNNNNNNNKQSNDQDDVDHIVLYFRNTSKQLKKSVIP